MLLLSASALAMCPWSGKPSVAIDGPNFKVDEAFAYSTREAEGLRFRNDLRDCGASDAIIQLDDIRRARTTTGVGLAGLLAGGLTLIVGSVQESRGAHTDAAPLFIVGGSMMLVSATFSISGPLRISYAKGRIVDSIQNRDHD